MEAVRFHDDHRGVPIRDVIGSVLGIVAKDRKRSAVIVDVEDNPPQVRHRLARRHKSLAPTTAESTDYVIAMRRLPCRSFKRIQTPTIGRHSASWTLSSRRDRSN